MRRLIVLVVLLAACGQESVSPPDPAPATDGPTTTTGTRGTDAATTAPDTSPGTEPGPGTEAPSEPTTSLPPLEGLEYETVASGLPFPTVLTTRPGEADPVIATKDGVVWRLGEDGETEPVLDISALVTNDGERGLLGAVFHPEDPARLFVHYSDGAGDTVVAEYPVSGWEADPDAAAVLFTHEQPAGNHNGGMIQFGPDGMLYLGLGDGGGANDEFGNGQNEDTLLAGLVRIDVDSGDAAKFAMGLRNPWRFWIDGERIFIADVGQGAFEEVNVAPLEAGLNYGWPITEGLHCFEPRRGCDTEGLTLPIVEVEHDDAGTCSITGGVVYRGPAIPEVDGQFFFSDFCGGYLRSVTASGDVTDWTDDVGVPGSVSSFGVDADGEMYVLTSDAVMKVVPVR
jgi:glucose/arabinose dehydrogenase